MLDRCHVFLIALVVIIGSSIWSISLFMEGTQDQFDPGKMLLFAPCGLTLDADIPPVVIIMGVLMGFVCLSIVVLAFIAVLTVVVVLIANRNRSHGRGIINESPAGNEKERKGKAPTKSKDRKGTGGPIICAGVTAVVLVVLLVLAAFTGLMTYQVLKDDPGEISITALDATSLEPFSMLEIKGSGFDPQHSAISVVFISDQDPPITISATYAESGKVRVVVPPYIDRYNTSGTCGVKVIQVSGDRVMTSNVLKGLEIGPMQELNGSMDPGRYTRLYLTICQESLNDMIINSTDSDLSMAFMDQMTWLMGVQEQLDRSIADDLEYLELEENSVDLTTLDDLILNMVTRTVEIFPANDSSPEPTRSEDNADEELKKLERMRSLSSSKVNEVGGPLIEAAAKFSLGMFMTVACLAGGAGLGLSLTAGIALGIGTSWLLQMASGEEPTPLTTLQTIGETVLDSRSFLPVAGLLGQLIPLYKAFNKAQDEVERFNKGEPGGGVVLNDMGNLRPPFEDLRMLYKRAPGAHTQKLLIPGDPSSVPFRDAIPPVLPGRVSYSGNFDGSKSFFRTTNCPQCGPIVNRIDYFVDGSMELVADVDGDGRLSGTLSVSGSWETSGEAGCQHYAVQVNGGPLSSSQAISGSTSGFSAGSGASEMVQGISCTMDPDSVYGEMSFQTTDGVFSVQYVLTPD
ncbi:MAG: hypothetical protein JXA22_05540 [Candidatus Thermoplasmatota archaeon]|nr:hypothetical protein [Candidatus Thermoplasmatota archaeon]